MLSRMFIDAPEDLVSSTCILPISIDLFYDETDGKERLQEGENLAATVHMLNQLGLKDCVIVISDLLQRHNATIDNNETVGGAAEEQARQAGARWRSRNDHIIARLTMPYEIIHWNQLKEHRHYAAQRALIQEAYNEKAEHGKRRILLKSLVSQVVRNFINGFARAHQKKGGPDEVVDFDLELAVELSIEYLLEELAVIGLWRDGNCPELVGDNEKIFMLYPYGKSATSQDVYNCIRHVCDDRGNLGLKDIKKGEPVTTKVLSQQKQEKKPGATRKDRKKGREEPTTKPARTDDAFSAEQADESSTQIGDLILGTLTLKFSRNDIRHQIAAFHGAVSYVARKLELQEKAQQLLSEPREGSGALNQASSSSFFALTCPADLGQESLEEGPASGDSVAQAAASKPLRRSASSPLFNPVSYLFSERPNLACAKSGADSYNHQGK